MIIDPRLRNVKITPHGYSGSYRHLLLLATERVEVDGKKWRHVSVSRRDHTMPTYDDLMTLKSICIGDHRTALQVLPPKSQHVDWAGRRGIQVLHLWCCLDGDVTPDFRIGGII